MLPKPPPKLGQLGFLYFPPIRVEGTSVAGEATAVMVPEFDTVFDIGFCARSMLAAKYVAVTHGHMDHVAALPYYFSQRWFQGMGMGVCLCDKRIEPALRNMMLGWVDVEQQHTSHEIVGLTPDDAYEIKNNLFLQPFEVDHTVPSMGWSVVEKRSKLKPELLDQPQERLRELKAQGVEITRQLRVPLLAYVGDTLPGPHLLRDEVRQARVLILECTFFEPDHKERAGVGKHVHVDDIAELVARVEAEAIVLTHISRRTNLGLAKKELRERLGAKDAARVHILMDHQANRARYEAQCAQAQAQAQAAATPTVQGSTPAPKTTTAGQGNGEAKSRDDGECGHGSI